MLFPMQAIGYDFDYDEYHRYVDDIHSINLLKISDLNLLIYMNLQCFSFVHGRLPYENLKPDPVLRSHLLSLPIRKVVSLLRNSFPDTL